jgi:hypothetical protein
VLRIPFSWGEHSTSKIVKGIQVFVILRGLWRYTITSRNNQFLNVYGNYGER